MSTILDEIVLRKKVDIINFKMSNTLLELKESCFKSTQSFYNAFDLTRNHYILECKKASPSKGTIRSNFDPEAIATIYNNYATAISVLTDAPYFQGSFDYLRKVREVSGLPLLCKDFIFDEYQIYQARYYGADAILLILEILTDEEYLELSSIAESLNMGVLTEVANEQQAYRAKALKSRIVGINNRNLKDFSIDPNKAKNLAKILKDMIIISESGIACHADIFYQQKFVHGFLIGTSLMKEDNIDLACRSILLGQHKLCGVRNQKILDGAAECGFSYVGFNFVKSSKRFIEVELAENLNTNLKKVGVFQNENIEIIIDHATRCSLAAIQLHGNENSEYIDLLRTKLDPAIAIWKAISVDECVLEHSCHIDLFILDSKNHEQFGGTGLSFDWKKIQNIPKDKILIAGGIGVDNCEDALRQGALGLDFNSKLEGKTGEKSLLKMKEVFKKIKQFRG